MFSKLHPRTTSRTLLVLFASSFLAVILFTIFKAAPNRMPFVSSTTSATTIKPALYPSEIKNESCNIQRPSSHPLQPPEDPHLHNQIRSYVAFHAKARACLLNPSCKPVPRILVATCTRDGSCLGLGDRMRGLLFSFTIALITKRVLFVHKLGELYPLESALVPYAVDWTLPSTVIYNTSWPHLEWQWCRKGRKCEGNAPALTDLESFDDVGPRINLLTDDIHKEFGDRPAVTISSRYRYSRLNFIQKNPHLRDKYGDLAKYQLERRMNFFRLMFQPTLPVSQMMKPVEFKGDYISVHIRTGVDAREGKIERFSYLSTHEEETVERAFRCMEKVAKNITKIFLASDSLNTKEIFKRKAEERGYEVQFFEKKTVHYAQARLGTGKDAWDGLCEALLTVFADLFMLSRGKVMIKTGSHFADLAWFFSKNQREFWLKGDSACHPVTT